MRWYHTSSTQCDGGCVIGVNEDSPTILMWINKTDIFSGLMLSVDTCKIVFPQQYGVGSIDFPNGRSLVFTFA